MGTTALWDERPPAAGGVGGVAGGGKKLGGVGALGALTLCSNSLL